MRRITSDRSWMMIQTALLGILTWTVLVGHTGLTSQATAHEAALDIPDAASQRIEMIKELHKLNDAMGDLRKNMEKMEFKVKVTAMPVESKTPPASGANSNDGNNGTGTVTVTTSNVTSSADK